MLLDGKTAIVLKKKMEINTIDVIEENRILTDDNVC